MHRPLKSKQTAPSMGSFELVIARETVDAGDLHPSLFVLEGLMSSPDLIKTNRQNVTISFWGYQDNAAEVWEIKSVRDYVKALDAKFPYWLYFLSMSSWSLKVIALCLLRNPRPPITLKRFGRHVIRLCDSRWTPALNEVCETLGLPHEVSLHLMLDGFESCGLPVTDDMRNLKVRKG